MATMEIFTKSSDKEDDEDLKMCNCPDQQDQERLLCINCSKYVCYDCFLDHRDHEVVSDDELDDAVESYEQRVRKELAEAQQMTDSCEKDVEVVQMNLNFEEIHDDVESFHNLLHTAMKEQLDIGKAEYSKVKRIRDEALKEANMHFNSLSNLSSKVAKNIEQIQDSPKLIFLQKLNNFRSEISQGIKKAKGIGEIMESVVQYLPASLSARFATITVGPVIGAVRVNKRQVIIVTDQRLKDPPTIHLSCVSCDNTAENYWSLVIEYSTVLGATEKLPMIAMCNSLRVVAPKIYILIACGLKIIRIEILEPSEFCYHNFFTVEEVEGLPDGSHITCMKVIPRPLSPANVLIIDSVSKSISRLDEDLSHMETLLLEDKAYLAAGVFENSQYIYAYYNGTEIKIVNGALPTNVIEVIQTPSGPHDLSPADMIHDGAVFSVLWKSRDSPVQSNKLSKVVTYSTEGELKGICHEHTEGIREGIGISYVRNGGLLCLENGKVALYDTIVREFDIHSLLRSLLE